MKINMIKQPGGLLTPFDDREAMRMERFSTGEAFEVDIKLSRNPKFHGKVFAFFNYCYEFWKEQRRYQFACDKVQYDHFRKELTILAGFYNDIWDLHGNVSVDAKSLAFANMEQDEFENCYEALINAAMGTIFEGLDDQDYYNKLAGFF